MSADDDALKARLKLEEDRRLGEECATFLRSEAVNAFLKDTEDSLLKTALSLLESAGDPVADKGRDACLVGIKTVRKMRSYFEKCVNTGVYSEKMLETMMKEDPLG